MAVTPSKDYKRREREQRKLEKRMAREAAKAEKLEAKYAEEDAAEKAAEEQARLDAMTPEEREFELELEAERTEECVRAVHGASRAVDTRRDGDTTVWHTVRSGGADEVRVVVQGRQRGRRHAQGRGGAVADRYLSRASGDYHLAAHGHGQPEEIR